MDNLFSSEDVNKDMIICFLQGKLMASEELVLMNWIAEGKENEAIFLDYRDIFIKTTYQQTEKKTFDPENAWEKLSGKINPGKPRTINWFLFSKMAAAFALVFLLGAAISLFYKPSIGDSARQLCEIVTPLGAKSQVTLPDGTMIWLNAGSRLIYQKDFNDKSRIVSLEGEAYFKVKTNKDKPFIVNASGIKVKATGTIFNVKAYPNDKSVTATLVEGVIKVEVKGLDKKLFSYTLKPNQNITYTKDFKSFKTEKPTTKSPIVINQTNKSAPIKPMEGIVLLNNHIKPEILTSWKDTRWLIEGEELDNLGIMIERRYNVKVHIKSDQLLKFKFSGTIENETLEQVLGILRLTTPLKYEIGKGEIWWDIDNKLVDKYSGILTKSKH